MRAKVNGTEIAYVERGKGKNTIVFVHGLGENKESWRYQTEHFSKKTRTIAVDLRGHGESGDSNISLDIFVEDLRALIDKLGAKEIILCGLSMGGAISMAFYSKYPERVKAMVLSDTSSGFSRETAERMLSQRMDYIENKGMEELGKFIANGALTENASEDLREEVRKMFASNKIGPYKEATKVAILSNLDDVLPTIKVPVLIMVGEKDRTTPVELAKHLNERINGSELRIIPGAAHLTKLEKPELFNSYMEEFLTKRGFL
jgi:pimeloyl-ACP methyl ester carboxylesterase